MKRISFFSYFVFFLMIFLPLPISHTHPHETSYQTIEEAQFHIRQHMAEYERLLRMPETGYETLFKKAAEINDHIEEYTNLISQIAAKQSGNVLKDKAASRGRPELIRIPEGADRQLMYRNLEILEGSLAAFDRIEYIYNLPKSFILVRDVKR